MISTLAGRGDYVVLDADSHASIYDGCFLGDAEIVRFRHNSVEDLDKRLGRLPADALKLVVLEGVYSMLGDVAPLPDMVAAVRKHRSDERRVGKECVRTCRSRWSPYHYKKKNYNLESSI